MPKIRSLKAEFFQDEDASTSLVVKVLAAGLICCMADDFGRFKALPATIKALVFTHDRVTLAQIGEGLATLQRLGFIYLYEANGKPVAQIKNWEREQYIPTTRRTASTIPEHGANTVSAVQTHGGDTAPTLQAHDTAHLAREKGKEGKGKEVTPLPPASLDPATKKLGLRIIEWWCDRQGWDLGMPLISRDREKGIAMVFAAMPLDEDLLYAVLNDLWSAAKKKPSSLNYFSAALERAVSESKNDPAATRGFDGFQRVSA